MSESVSIYLGNELKKIREEKAHLSQVDFSKFLNISKSLVCRVESGERKYNQIILNELFIKLNLDSYHRIKFLLLSDFSFEIKNSIEDKENVIKLLVELKNNNYIILTKRLINKSLDIFNASVDFYVLLSTINLIEKNYDEAEINIKKALILYRSDENSISSKLEIYHNYGNIFFNVSYDYEMQKIKLVSDLFNKGFTKEDIINNHKYIDLNKTILDLYQKSEKLFIQAQDDSCSKKSYSSNQQQVSAQLSRLYFNLVSVDNSYLEKSLLFISNFLQDDNISIEDRTEISIFMSILLAIKGDYEIGLIILNNILAYNKENVLAMFAKAIVYSLNYQEDINFLSKALDYIEKILDIDNSLDMKLQIEGEINFYNIRKNPKSFSRLKKILLSIN
ncbi:MAG: helix-turn-helix domain-containing protein [Candidatus Sericytochromatia bacterium]